ncbi:septum formation initiator [Micromonospora yasonensis]|uniref:septum formation initiator n=1 Tax=Micromonospora yasonensis TaxID=1128667 RepID=UPI0022312C76|nr:septum formation initiator [Micromonospora yasonensis]MCW3844366.1 septum formation initiator [Micromonospora yasonensis]
MGRHPILAAVGWLAATVAATLVGVGAIQLVGAGITTGTPGGVRDQRDVERALAAPEPVSPPPSREATPEPTPTAGPSSPSPTGGARGSFSGAGGRAVAECGPSGVRLVFWAPAQGYQVKEVERGPDDHVKVRFVGPPGEQELRLRCVDGEPVVETHD